MKASTKIVLSTFTALVAAAPYDCPSIVTVTIANPEPAASTVPMTGTLQASIVPFLSPLSPITVYITGPQPRPTTTTQDDNLMTIAVTNQHGDRLSLSLASDANSPSPIGNPAPTVLPDASPIEYTFPTGWAGRICVGPNLSPEGSKIEGSFTGPPDIDVSYVDGYSVPITCSSNGVAVSGCNLDLFAQEDNPCENEVQGPVCLNSAQNVPDGPPPRFFADCAGAAYTFPKDDGANVGNLSNNLISCCIGTSCPAPSRQPQKVV